MSNLAPISPDNLMGHLNGDGFTTIGIDATNIRQGGGITHLIELIDGVDLDEEKINLVVWGGKEIVNRLPRKRRLKIINPDWHNKNLVMRVLWQALKLDAELKKMHCNVLFVPGGSYVGKFRPVVCMSQNLIPFDGAEMRRIKWTLNYFKMWTLKIIQRYSFKRVDGLIFLTQYAKKKVIENIGVIKGKQIIIPHGLNPKFNQPLKSKGVINLAEEKKLFRLLYVSNIARYKHQLEVLRACKFLRDRGLPVEITFIGFGVDKEILVLNSLMKELDPECSWSKYLGVIDYNKLPQIYTEYDIGIFASSCETFGIILLEKMASGLPIACSEMSCMPEILRDAGAYFNPESYESIANAIEKYIKHPELRAENGALAQDLARKFSWVDTAKNTWAFIKEISGEFNK